ncbi:MAG: ABC transporter ATP-binding protein, partial [Anaerolineae bacterium]|nr:ABC transporter ATP-binding protein [Anaerolineae bacterium]
RSPRHPYTQLLLQSVPKLRSVEKPTSISGIPPDLIEPPSGCRFHPRCPYAFEKCPQDPPYFENGSKATCWLLEEGEAS